MWHNTRVTERLGIHYPIIQGPFGGGLSSTMLAAAVSNAGGLGSFGLHHLPPTQIKEVIHELKSRTTYPFAVNLWLPLQGETETRLNPVEFSAHVARLKPYFDKLNVPEPSYQETFGQRFEDQFDAILEAQPPVFSFIFGVLSQENIYELQKRNIKTIGAATTVEEAQALDATDIDVIVASGSDAGGHRPSFLRSSQESLVGTFSLVPQIVSAVRKPVVAAGGIADGRGIAAALALGAEGVQIGTAFLATHESAASEAHKTQLVSENARYTTLTRVFSGRYARGIRNQFIDEMNSQEIDLPPYPIQNWFTQPIRRAAAELGNAEFLSLWSGQAAALTQRRSAAECFAALLQQTEQTLAALAAR